MIYKRNSNDTVDQAVMKSHYDTLGVSSDASTEEIKSTFRKLSLETHPDVGGPNACAERFKEIAEAASVLSHPEKRSVYDRKLTASSPFGRGLHRQSSAFSAAQHAQRQSGHQPTSGLPLFVHNLMRPRTFILGTAAVFATAYASKLLVGEDENSLHRHQQGKDLVKAWKNPKTGNYESPAPWDPTYRELQPVLELVPRDQVKKRFR